MSKKMLIDASHREETRVALISGGKVEDFDFESLSKKPLRGNIYLARVTRVEPSLQAAFVEYGGNRHGFLAFSEIHSDYYQIPVSDREALRDAEEREAELAMQLTSLTGDPIDDDPRGAVDDEDETSDGDSDTTSSDELDDSAEENSEDESKTPSDSVDYEVPLEAEADESVQATETEKEPEVDKDDNFTPEDNSDGEDETTDTPDGVVENIALSHSAIESEELSFPVPSEDASEDEDDHAESEDQGDEHVSSDESENNEEDGAEETSAKKKSKEPSLEQQYQQARRDRIKLLKNYRIQEVIKRRQILLIQVVKEERGNKGAAVTTYLSLAGRYCVLMPNTARGGGISRKIANGSDRKRLRKAMNELSIPQGMGLIIRTAGAKRTKSEIKRDFDYLLRLWENIRDLTMKSIAPCLIYEEASLIKRAIRDLYDKDISQVLVEGEAGYREAKDFMKMLMPSHAKNVQPYKEKVPLFLNFKVEPQLDEMYQPVVKLKSGGYLVIQQTEALISVDVNSGKATKERNIEATALKTNLEAAQEVARQCRLRDLAGLLVIDFIDMEENRNNRSVEKKLKDAMKQDRARIQFGRISNFGLLEMSRQRRRSGIVDGTTSQCPTCNGAGAIRSHEMAALRILRSIEEEALNGRAGIISASTSADVALYILNEKRDWLNRIEETYSLRVEIIADRQKAGDQYEIEKRGPARELDRPVAVVTADLAEIPEDEIAVPAQDEDETEEKPSRKRRRRRRRKNQSAATSEDQSSTEASNDEASTADEENQTEAQSDGEEEEGGKRRRRRGRRGGRRNRRRNDESATEITGSDDPTNHESDSTPAEVDPAAPIPEVPDQAETGTSVSASEETPAEKTELDTAEQPPEIEEEPHSLVASQDDDHAASIQEVANDHETAELAGDDMSDKPKRKGWWQKALGRN